MIRFTQLCLWLVDAIFFWRKYQKFCLSILCTSKITTLRLLCTFIRVALQLQMLDSVFQFRSITSSTNALNCIRCGKQRYFMAPFFHAAYFPLRNSEPICLAPAFFSRWASLWNFYAPVGCSNASQLKIFVLYVKEKGDGKEYSTEKITFWPSQSSEVASQQISAKLATYSKVRFRPHSNFICFSLM